MWLVNNAVSNIICVLVFGERFEYSNNDFQALLKDINEVIFLEGSAWAQVILSSHSLLFVYPENETSTVDTPLSSNKLFPFCLLSCTTCSRG